MQSMLSFVVIGLGHQQLCTATAAYAAELHAFRLEAELQSLPESPFSQGRAGGWMSPF